MRLRYKLVSIGAVLAAVFLWGRCSKPIPPVPAHATVLPKDDSEQIIVRPEKHQLIIVKPTGTQVLTLPDRDSVIDLRKNGKVDVTSPQFGLEHRFFFGVYGSDRFRVAAGMDAFYFKKLDIGLGLAGELGPHIPIGFAQASYNIWSNCRIGIAYGSDRYVGGTFTVRL